MRTEKCGCVFEGPIQVIVCRDPEHNVAAKNANRAQVIIAKTELSNVRLTAALQKMIDCSYGCQCTGPNCTATDDAELLIQREGQVAHEKMADNPEELGNLAALLEKRIAECDIKKTALENELKLVLEKKAKLEGSKES